MHRQYLLDLLIRYRPEDSNEKDMKQNIISFINSHQDCFERSQLKGHITGSAWIVDPSHSQCLLLHHRKLDRWLQPGGHSDGESNTLNVATREAVEETGLQSIQAAGPEIFDVDIHSIPQRKNEPEHFHYDIRFLFVADPDETINRNNESNAVEWFSLNKLDGITDEESVLRMVRKTISGS